MAKVEVKEQHIKNGKFGSACNCPIALALKEQLKNVDPFNAFDVFVMGDHAQIKGEKKYLPDIAVRFIRDFDMRKQVQPISFEI